MTRSSPLQESWLGEIDSWQVAEADKITRGIGDISISGQVIIGPHPAGGQAIIPPDVYSYTPSDRQGINGAALTKKGWRHGIWESADEETVDQYYLVGYPVNGDEENLVWVTGRERPLLLSAISLEKALYIVKAEAPEEPKKLLSDFLSSAGQQ